MKTTELQPFGLLVEVAGLSFDAIPTDQLNGWIDTHKLVVLRGVSGMSKRTQPVVARALGPLQPWSFGSVNVLKVDPEKKNYLFTHAEVPLHWDGAFKGEIPRLLMFHCLQAPPKEARGATLFVHAQAVVADLDDATRQAYDRAEFEYETEKVVHYGGRFASKLIAPNPRNGEACLRFAEPVHDLNPVTVTPRHAGFPSAEDVAERLRTTPHRRLHVWEDNDVVLADNHALLHGRQAFAHDAPRWIHRVNILDETEVTGWRKIVDSVRIRRPEFMVAEIPINLIPLIWLAPAGGWFGWAYLEASLVFLLLFHFGDMVNCLADRDLDAVYKTTQSEAIHRLGVRNVTLQIAGTALVAVALTAHLAFVTGSWILVPLVLTGLVLGHQYSYGPMRLKSAGLIQFAALWSIIFVGPMALMCLATLGMPSVSTLAVIALYGGLAQSIILVNTAEDFDEDVEAEIHTAAVALGRRQTIEASAALVGLFGAGLFAVFATTLYQEQSGGLPWFCLGLWTSAWAWSTLEIGHLAYRVRVALDPDAMLKRGAAKMPVWLTVLAWLSLMVVIARAVG